MRVYVSGPMSGLVDLNIAAFVKMAERLAAAGHRAVTPFDYNGCFEADRKACLRWNAKQLLQSRGIVALENWQNSPNARFEMTIAEGLSLLNLDRETLKWTEFELPLEAWKPPVIIRELAKAGIKYYLGEASWGERTYGASYARQTLPQAIRARTRAVIRRLLGRIEHEGNKQKAAGESLLFLREDETLELPPAWLDRLPSR